MGRRALILAVLLVTSAACGSSGPDDGGSRGLPPVGAVVDYQLGGAYDPADDVDVVVRDRTAEPAAGRYSLCYVNAFQTQPGEADAWDQDLLLRDAAGTPVEDPDWPGEVLLDISTPDRRERVAAVVGDWIRQCADDGFAGIEADNLDSSTRSGGLLDQADAEAYAALLVEAAHDAGLVIAQKNTPDLDGPSIGFDLAVAEECAVYDECGSYTELYGGHVIEIEYTDNGTAAFADVCEAATGTRSILLRDRDVTTPSDPAYVFESC